VNHHQTAHSPLPAAPVPKAAIVRLRDGATLGARVAPCIYGSARWLRCRLLTEPPASMYVAVETVAWVMWVTEARAREVAARYGDRFLNLAVGAPSTPPAGPAQPADASTAPPPATEVLDSDFLEPVEDGAAPRVWLAVQRPPAGDRAVAPAEWASSQGAFLPEVRPGCVVFQVVAAAEGRVRAAAGAAGLALVDCCGPCGWTDDLGGERAVSEGVCSACRAGEGEP